MIARPRLDVFKLLVDNQRWFAYCSRWVWAPESRFLVYDGGCYRTAVFAGQGCCAAGRGNGSGDADGGGKCNVHHMRKVASQLSDGDSCLESSGRAHSPKSCLCDCEHASDCCCELEDALSSSDTGISELSETMWKQLFCISENDSGVFAEHSRLRSQAFTTREPRSFYLPSESPCKMALCIPSETGEAVYEFGLITGHCPSDLQEAMLVQKIEEKLRSYMKELHSSAKWFHDFGEVDETPDLGQQLASHVSIPGSNGRYARRDVHGVWDREPEAKGTSLHCTMQPVNPDARCQHSSLSDDSAGSQSYGDNPVCHVSINRTQKHSAAGTVGNRSNNSSWSGHRSKIVPGSEQGVVDLRLDSAYTSLGRDADSAVTHGVVARHHPESTFPGIDGMSTMSSPRFVGRVAQRAAVKYTTWGEQSSVSQVVGNTQGDVFEEWFEDSSNILGQHYLDGSSGVCDLIPGSSSYGCCPSPTSGLCSNPQINENAMVVNLPNEIMDCPGTVLESNHHDGLMNGHLGGGGMDQEGQDHEDGARFHMQRCDQGGVLHRDGRDGVAGMKASSEDDGMRGGEEMVTGGGSRSKWYPEYPGMMMTDPGYSLLDDEVVDPVLCHMLQDPDQLPGASSFGTHASQVGNGRGLSMVDNRSLTHHQQSVQQLLQSPLAGVSMEGLLVNANSEPYRDLTSVFPTGNTVICLEEGESISAGTDNKNTVTGTAQCFGNKKMPAAAVGTRTAELVRTGMESANMNKSSHIVDPVAVEKPSINRRRGVGPKQQKSCLMVDVELESAPALTQRGYPTDFTIGSSSMKPSSGDGVVSSSQTAQRAQSRARSSQTPLMPVRVATQSSPMHPTLHPLKPEVGCGSKSELLQGEGGENKVQQKCSPDRKRARKAGGNQGLSEDKDLYDDLEDSEGTARGGGKRRHPEPNSTAIAERDRRRRMNQAFEALRGRVPDAPRRGKADLLERAARYISELQALQGGSAAPLAVEQKRIKDGASAFECDDTQQQMLTHVQLRQQQEGAFESSKIPGKDGNVRGRRSGGGDEESDSDIGLQSDAASVVPPDDVTGAVSIDEDPVAVKMEDRSSYPFETSSRVVFRRWIEEKATKAQCALHHQKRLSSGGAQVIGPAGGRGKMKGLNVVEDEVSRPTSPAMDSEEVRCEFHIAQLDGCVERIALVYPADGCRENYFAVGARIQSQLSSFKLQVKRVSMDVENGWIQVNICFEKGQELSETGQVVQRLEESIRKIFFPSGQESSSNTLLSSDASPMVLVQEGHT